MELNDNIFRDRISEFLDGELSPEESKELFEYLAYHPELQEELRQFVALKNLFHKDLIEPPKSTKIHLYSKLNLQRSAVFLSLLLTIGSELRRFIFSPAFVATIIGIALFTFSYFANQKENDHIFPLKKSSTIITKNSDNVKNNTSPGKISSDNYPVIQSKNISSQKHKLNTNLQNLENLANLPNNETFSPYNKITIERKTNPNEINYSKNNIEISSFSRHKNPLIYKHNNSDISLTSEYDVSNFIERISLTINKSNSKSTISTNLEPLSNPLLNDYSISIGYLLNKNNSVGIEFGQENYSQQFNGVIDGKYADVTQVFTAQWYGLAYQYNFGEINSFFNINPFSRFVFGGTSIGPIFKGILGISYQANEKLTIQSGFEYSNLFYKFDNNWFSSDKYGIFYGVKIGF
ncbi:MAG: anti-sigma factor family protein [Candidatus Kapaibacteriota bacterium]